MKTQQFCCSHKVKFATNFVAQKAAYFLSNSAVPIPLFPYRQKKLGTAESALLPISACSGVPVFRKHSGNSGNSEIHKKGVL